MTRISQRVIPDLVGDPERKKKYKVETKNVFILF
jgi:hypothetical protein